MIHHRQIHDALDAMIDCAMTLDTELNWGVIGDEDHAEISGMVWDSHTLTRMIYATWRADQGAHDRQHRQALQIVAGRLLLVAHDPRTCEAAWPAQTAAVAIAAAADMPLPAIIEGGQRFEVELSADDDERF